MLDTDLVDAPPSFILPQETHPGESAIFIDFKNAHHQIQYNKEKNEVEVQSTIDFEAHEMGHPIFNLLPSVERVWLDGVSTSYFTVFTPHQETSVQVLNDIVYPGDHQLTFYYTLKKDTHFKKNGVTDFFKLNPIQGENLNQYFPSNFEFDRYPITLDASFLAFKSLNQGLITNGFIKKETQQGYQVLFPLASSSPSPLIYFIPKNQIHEKTLNLASRSFTLIKEHSLVSLNKFKNTIEKELPKIEALLGPIPRSSFFIFASLAKESSHYSGAAETSFSNLTPSLFKMIFSQIVPTTDASSLWISEALGEWYRQGMPRLYQPEFEPSSLGGCSPYLRKPHDQAKKWGAKWIAYLDSKIAFRGGMKAFLHDLYQGNTQTPYLITPSLTTQRLRELLELFSGLELKEEFDLYLFHCPSE